MLAVDPEVGKADEESDCLLAVEFEFAKSTGGESRTVAIRRAVRRGAVARSSGPRTSGRARIREKQSGGAQRLQTTGAHTHQAGRRMAPALIPTTMCVLH